MGGCGQEGLVLRSPPCRLPNNPLPLRLQRGLLKLAAGLVRGQESLLLLDAGQGLPAHGAASAPDAAPTNDLVAIRLQCRVPWVLPLPDQAVVREQARMVLPAHGPWLPDDASSLRSVMVICLEQQWCMRRWQEQLSCSPAPSSSACSHSPGVCQACPLATGFGAMVVHTPAAEARSACSTAPSSVCINH